MNSSTLIIVIVSNFFLPGYRVPPFICNTREQKIPLWEPIANVI